VGVGRGDEGDRRLDRARAEGAGLAGRGDAHAAGRPIGGRLGEEPGQGCLYDHGPGRGHRADHGDPLRGPDRPGPRLERAGPLGEREPRPDRRDPRGRPGRRPAGLQGRPARLGLRRLQPGHLPGLERRRWRPRHRLGHRPGRGEAALARARAEVPSQGREGGEAPGDRGLRVGLRQPSAGPVPALGDLRRPAPRRRRPPRGRRLGPRQARGLADRRRPLGRPVVLSIGHIHARQDPGRYPGDAPPRAEGDRGQGPNGHGHAGDAPAAGHVPAEARPVRPEGGQGRRTG
jgi:hypothetical protein